MRKFIRKPYVIEAVQVTRENNEEVIHFLKEQGVEIVTTPGVCGWYFSNGGTLTLTTLDRVLTIPRNFWLVNDDGQILITSQITFERYYVGLREDYTDLIAPLDRLSEQ